MKRINGAMLHGLINSVHLGGIINEAVVSVEDKEARIRAVDPTNMLFVDSTYEIDIPDMEIGLTDLGTVLKLLSNNDVMYELSEKGQKQWMKLKIKNRGTAKLLLTEPEQIPTYTEKEYTGDAFLEKCKYSVELSKGKLNSILYFLETFKPLSVVLHVNDSNNAYIKTAKTEKKQFSVFLGTVDCPSKITIDLYVDHLLAVLKHLKDKDDFEIHLTSSKKPMIIIWDCCVWSLAPIDESTGEGTNKSSSDDYDDDIPF